MSAITTHILDTARGCPAAHVPVKLERQVEGAWSTVSDKRTDADGRVRDLLSDALQTGLYRLTFDTATYFKSTGVKAFFPQVEVVFDIQDTASHYHVPLLLSPFSYSTYRGS